MKREHQFNADFFYRTREGRKEEDRVKYKAVTISIFQMDGLDLGTFSGRNWILVSNTE